MFTRGRVNILNFKDDNCLSGIWCPGIIAFTSCRRIQDISYTVRHISLFQDL